MVGFKDEFICKDTLCGDLHSTEIALGIILIDLHNSGGHIHLVPRVTDGETLQRIEHSGLAEATLQVAPGAMDPCTYHIHMSTGNIHQPLACPAILGSHIKY